VPEPQVVSEIVRGTASLFAKATAAMSAYQLMSLQPFLEQMQILEAQLVSAGSHAAARS
jgi:hypothetical protein